MTETLGSGAPPSDDGIRGKMVTAAREAVIAAGGIGLGNDVLDAARLADAAGVDRRRVRRIWPTNRAFLVDMLCELAGPKWQGAEAYPDPGVIVTKSLIAEHLADLATLEGRQAMLHECARISVGHHLPQMIGSGRWRTFGAGLALAHSVAPGDGGRLHAAVRASEESWITYLVRLFLDLGGLLGFRPQAGTSWLTMATTCSAVADGVSLIHAATPETVTSPVEIAEYGNGPWQLAALIFMCALDRMIEWDPDYHPDQAVADYLRTMADRELE